jgi:hypothetical protein
MHEDGPVSLASTQRAFAAALSDSAQVARAAALIDLDSASAMRRLAVYRGNGVAASIKALSSAYPVVGQIVGDEFFAGLAREYARANPSTSGDLTGFGHNLGPFLEVFAPAVTLPYLADVARLEWAVHSALCAADAARLDPAELAGVAPALQGDLRFEVLPGTRVLRSIHPIALIWAIHQADFADPFSVDLTQGECVLVSRDGFTVSVRALGAGEYALYESLIDGATLSDALDRALAAQADCAAAELIVGLLQSGPIAGFRLAPLSKERA